TYMGGTTVNAGTLEIANSVAGNVTNTGGVLKLDSASVLSSTAALSLVSTLPSGSVNLNFTGVQALNAIYIDGYPQVSGTWGSPTFGAQNTSPMFTGSGKLNVLGSPVIAQQPQSMGVYPDSSATFSVVVSGDP